MYWDWRLLLLHINYSFFLSLLFDCLKRLRILIFAGRNIWDKWLRHFVSGNVLWIDISHKYFTCIVKFCKKKSSKFIHMLYLNNDSVIVDSTLEIVVKSNKYGGYWVRKVGKQRSEMSALEFDSLNGVGQLNNNAHITFRFADFKTIKLCSLSYNHGQYAWKHNTYNINI